MQESEKWKWSRSVVSDSSDPMDCSLPGSSVHGIFQARVLEWGAIAFSDNLSLQEKYLLRKEGWKEGSNNERKEKVNTFESYFSIRFFWNWVWKSCKTFSSMKFKQNKRLTIHVKGDEWEYIKRESQRGKKWEYRLIILSVSPKAYSREIARFFRLLVKDYFKTLVLGGSEE